MAEYPKNVEELFLDTGWKLRITRAVSGFKSIVDVDDVVQDIFVLMLSRNDPGGLGRDYVERWDPSMGGSFSNWIYTFVRNHCSKLYTRSTSRGGRAIEGALQLVSASEQEENENRNVVSQETLGGSSQHISTAEILEACRAVAHNLRLDSPANSWVEYVSDGYFVCDVAGTRTFFPDSEHLECTEQSCKRDAREACTVFLAGTKVERDPATVLERLVLEEAAPLEIASQMKTSRQFIYDLIGKIRGDEELDLLRLSLGFRSKTAPAL